jgi:hypothetical protein
MNADHAAASMAFIFFLLFLKKLPDAVLFYEKQVLDHAHAVFRAVAKVERAKALARELPALEAIFHFPLHQFPASLFDECAILSARPASRAGHDPLFPVFAVAHVRHAYFAVHAAGRY